MTDEIPKPEGRSISIKLEDCWSQVREGEQDDLFFKASMAALRKVPDQTEVIFPHMEQYAIIPIEDYEKLLQLVPDRLLDDRMVHMKKHFLKWLWETRLH
jgi:hypothetical protein